MCFNSLSTRSETDEILARGPSVVCTSWQLVAVSEGNLLTVRGGTIRTEGSHAALIIENSFGTTFLPHMP